MSDLTLHRILKAPRALVWRCWTEPDQLKRWFTPKPVQTVHAEIDLRPGGRFFTVMLIDGTEHPSDGCILEVVPQEKLVFTDTLTADYKPAETPFFAAILTFRDHPEGTDYTALARHKDDESARRHAEMGFHDGWGKAADQLEDLARSLA